jgi:hypothetical protein
MALVSTVSINQNNDDGGGDVNNDNDSNIYNM